MLTRRRLFSGLFKGGLFFSFGLLHKATAKKKTGNIKLIRTFHYPDGSTPEQVTEELKTYMNHNELYFLDIQFQTAGKLLETKCTKPTKNKVILTRVFNSQASCDEWRELYKQKCVLKDANLTLFRHRLEERIAPA